MSYAMTEKEPGGTASALLSALVHLVLFAFLYLGVHWRSRAPETVSVELWNRIPSPPAPSVATPPAPKVEPPKAEAPPAKIETPPKPAPPKAEAPPRKPDIAVERERRKREPPLKFDTTQMIREQLAQEEKALAQTRAPAASAPPAPAPPALDAAYADKIRRAIRDNIVLPANIQGNPEAEFKVVQLPTGEVLSVQLLRSSGNKVLDAAVERAIRKASPLPRPDRPQQFQRELDIKYRPFD